MYKGEHSERSIFVADANGRAAAVADTGDDRATRTTVHAAPGTAADATVRGGPGGAADTVVAVIPAWNEASTVGAVVYAARDAELVDHVIVVDNGSSDATAVVAAAHGAQVVYEAVSGKGEAMRTGVAAAEGATVVVFLDADLVGLGPGDVDALVRQVTHRWAAMACGLFDRGPLLNPAFLRLLPVLTGQRAVRRTLFDELDDDDLRGYRVEAALNSLVAQRDLVRHDRIVRGLWHRTKEEKLGSPVVGHVAKLAMLAAVCWSYARFAVGRRIPQPAG
jgi:glycosyltransferase involved in cell wall biosynthesis